MNIIVDLSLKEIVGCTDLSGKKLHRHVGVGIVVTTGSLRGVMASTLALNARYACSIHTVGTIFLIFISPTIHPSMYIYIYTYIHTCIYTSIHICM